jgi:hypothetical protein
MKECNNKKMITVKKRKIEIRKGVDKSRYNKQ